MRKTMGRTWAWLAVSVVALTLGMTALGARAQGKLEELRNTTPQERAAAQTEMMKSKLALTPDQTPKIAALNLKYAQEMEPVIKGSEGPFIRMRHAREISTRKEAELKQMLTPEQFEKYLASREEMREKFEEKMEKR